MGKAVALCVFVTAFFVIRGQTPPGGHHPVSPDNPSLQPAVVFAAAAINAACDCKWCQTVVSVENATEQVVDGVVYQFSVSLQESDQCLSSECMGSVPDNQCPPSAKAKPYWCDVDVVIKSWSAPTHFVRNMTC